MATLLVGTAEGNRVAFITGSVGKCALVAFLVVVVTDHPIEAS